MNLAISTHNLCKSYGGHAVLRNVNLAVPEGAVYGFVGANGAGKTTTIRILLGLAAASSGHATVLGTARGELPPTPVSGVAYLPDVPGISPWLRATDALITLARLDGTPADVAASRAADLLDVVGLAHVPGRVGSFSRGMKQRLGIAAALVSAPRLLVMDEPTSALDPLGRADLLAVIRELTGRATVLFSSHILGDVEKVSTHVGILDRGELLAQGAVEDLLTGPGLGTGSLRVTAPLEALNRISAAIRATEPAAAVEREGIGLESLFTSLSAQRVAVSAQPVGTNTQRGGRR